MTDDDKIAISDEQVTAILKAAGVELAYRNAKFDLALIRAAYAAGAQASQAEVHRLQDEIMRMALNAEKVYQAGVREGRERAAKVADTVSDKYAYGYYGNETDTADEIAAAIRAIDTSPERVDSQQRDRHDVETQAHGACPLCGSADAVSMHCGHCESDWQTTEQADACARMYNEAARYRWIVARALWRPGSDGIVVWEVHMPDPDIREGRLTESSVGEELGRAIDAAIGAEQLGARQRDRQEGEANR